MKKKLFFLGLLISLFSAGCSSGGGQSSSQSQAISSISSSGQDPSSPSVSSSEPSSESFSSQASSSASSSSQSVSSASSASQSASSSSESSASTDVEETISVTSVSLDRTSIEIYDDDFNTYLTETVSPSDATDKSVSWSSSNVSVVSVDEGNIVPHGTGSATITVKTNDGNKTATCKVTVKKAITIPNYVIHLKRSGTSEWVDEAIQVNGYNPSEYFIQNLSLSSGDEFKIHMYGDTWYGYSALKSSTPRGLVSAAASDDNFKVVQTGIYDIYSDYNVSDGGHIYLDRTDDDQIPDEVPVTDITLDRSAKYLLYRNEVTLVATVYPSHATNKQIRWSSSDPTIATVTSGGRVVAKEKTGSTTITAKTDDGGKIATCLIYCSSSSYADYCLTGFVGGRSRLYESSNPLKAIPMGSGVYIVPDVQLVAGDAITVTDNRGTRLKAGTSIYTYDVKDTETVNVILNVNDARKQYISLVNKTSREIYVKYPDNTNDSNLCAWLWVSGDDITPVWVKSSDLRAGSTGSRFKIPKKATQFTFFRASQTAKPTDGDYSSLGTSYRTIGPKTLSDEVYTYDCNT